MLGRSSPKPANRSVVVASQMTSPLPKRRSKTGRVRTRAHQTRWTTLGDAVDRLPPYREGPGFIPMRTSWSRGPFGGRSEKVEKTMSNDGDWEVFRTGADQVRRPGAE